MKFHIGDKVRVVADEARLREISLGEYDLTGKIGPVEWASNYNYKVAVKEGGGTWSLRESDLELAEPIVTTFVGHPNGGLEVVVDPALLDEDEVVNDLIPVSHTDYMSLSDAYDKHSRNLMSLKGEEYSIDGDFLAMENRLAGMLGDTPEYVSLVMAGKHIAALGIILLKNDPDEIKLAKLDERVRDATNLLKIMAAFIHAKQNDFSLHLGKEEKAD